MWAKWQKQHPEVGDTYSGNVKPGSPTNDATLNDNINMQGLGKDFTVREVMETASGTANGLMCFQYSNSIVPASTQLSKRDFSNPSLGLNSSQVLNTATPDTYDRSDKNNIRNPPRLSDKFVIDWKLTKKEIQAIRAAEEGMALFTDYVNSLPITVPASLAHLEKGTKNGYRSKTNAEQTKEDTLYKNLLAGFNVAYPPL